jgi:hypothetical protein
MGKKHHKQPAPPTPPPAKPAESLPDFIIKLVAVAVFLVGAITLATPWLRGVAHPLPPAGRVCWTVERSTSAGSRRDGHCDPADGWHVEDWPGAGRVSVPDRAWVIGRHY